MNSFHQLLRKHSHFFQLSFLPLTSPSPVTAQRSKFPEEGTGGPTDRKEENAYSPASNQGGERHLCPFEGTFLPRNNPNTAGRADSLGHWVRGWEACPQQEGTRAGLCLRTRWPLSHSKARPPPPFLPETRLTLRKFEGSSHSRLQHPTKKKKIESHLLIP